MKDFLPIPVLTLAAFELSVAYAVHLAGEAGMASGINIHKAIDDVSQLS